MSSNELKVRVEDDYDRHTAKVVLKALSQHIGTPITLVDDEGNSITGTPTEATDWETEPSVLTEREERIREEIEDIRKGGPERGHELIEDLDKLFVRDRLELIFDDIQFEDGTFANYSSGDRLPADGMITGTGRVDGRTLFFTANDYTVKAGSIGPQGGRKVTWLSERAVKARCPIVHLIDSTGARLDSDIREEGVTHANRMTGGRLFFQQSIQSGQIPQIGVLYGPDIAGSAYLPVFCDFLIMVEDTSAMAIASPRIVEEMTGESIDMQALGGADIHAEYSGSVDIVVPDEETAAKKLRQLLGYLPQDYRSELPTAESRPPASNPNELDAVIPDEPNEAYDVHEVIDRLVDGASWLELKKRFAPEIVTGLARIEGQPVGIIANQPDHVSGAIFPDSADKAAGFIWTCDAYGIPLIYLCDTPGFMVGSQVEKDGILKKGRKMIYATSNAQVRQFCVITRKAYGAGIYAMCGPAYEPDATLALPTAEISVMGPDAAVRAMFAPQIAEIEDDRERQEFIEELKKEYQTDVRQQASKMQFDELIPAGDLRDQLGDRLEAYENKRRRDFDRYHGTVLH